MDPRERNQLPEDARRIGRMLVKARAEVSAIAIHLRELCDASTRAASPTPADIGVAVVALADADRCLAAAYEALLCAHAELDA